MKLADFNRLVKFMEMTTSTSDGEALNAVRAANKLLAANNADWKKVFARLITIEVEVDEGNGAMVDPPPANRSAPGAAPVQPGKSQEQLDREANINRMFDLVLNKVTSGDFRGFLMSLHVHWEKKGYLTPAQYEALTRTYKRHMQQGGRR